MIVYDLRCAKGHVFEEWFENLEAFEAGAAEGSYSCPSCGDASISKALSAPRINAGSFEPVEAPCGRAPCAQDGCPMAKTD
ncbi:MAG: DUF1178 family protein [Proteobacteria bacterium]|nr:DUF1178 family protein [Pseudomonadota bacterium]